MATSNETATYIGDLATSPTVPVDATAGGRSRGGAEIRKTKAIMKASFPNVTGAVTATHTELNLLDGVTATTAELNILDGVTSTAAELNILDGVTATTTEINYLSGVTSAIQTQIDSAVPAGAVMPFAMATPPSGWLECNGAAVSRTTYATLFAAISTVYGVGNGSTTFNLPDLRGEFVRGWDHGAGNDPDAATRTNSGGGSTGDNVGTKQDDAIKKHIHKMNYQVKFPTNGAGAAVAGSATETQTSTTYNTTGPFNVGSSTYVGKSETRSRNVNMMYCIKS